MIVARSFLSVFFAVAFSTSALAKPSDYDRRKALRVAAEAEHLALQQSYEDAAVTMERAITLDPTSPDYHCRKSDFIFLAQDDDQEALKEIDRAIAMCKVPPAEYLSKKAGILERLGRASEALVLSNKVLTIKLAALTSKSTTGQKKAMGFFYAQRAGIQKSLNCLQESENDLSRALKFDPKSSDIHIHRAKIGSQLKHWPQVITDAGFVIDESHRGSPVLRKREAYLLLASAYAASKNYDKATSTYLAALKECNDDRLVLSESHKYFASIGDKKNAAQVKKRLDSLDEDFVPFK